MINSNKLFCKELIDGKMVKWKNGKMEKRKNGK